MHGTAVDGGNLPHPLLHRLTAGVDDADGRVRPMGLDQSAGLGVEHQFPLTADPVRIGRQERRRLLVGEEHVVERRLFGQEGVEVSPTRPTPNPGAAVELGLTLPSTTCQIL